MFKNLCILITLSMPISGFANEYCYDDGRFAVADAKENLVACGVKINLASLDALERAIRSIRVLNSGYNNRVVRALDKVYIAYNNEFRYGETTKDNACIQSELKKFSALKVAVLDTMVMCSY